MKLKQQYLSTIFIPLISYQLMLETINDIVALYIVFFYFSLGLKLNKLNNMQ